MAIKFLNTVQVDTDVLYVDAANDRVGIGTTSPDAKLHVEGNVLIDAYNQGEDNGLFFREGFLTIDQPSITVWDMSNAGASPDGLSINSNDGIRFRENGGEVARFKDGNFGIGTTSPSTELSVRGAISAITSDYVQGTTGSRLLMHSAGTGNSHSYIQAQSSGGASSGEDLALQLYGGNVGIGTDSPSEKLEVDGNLAVSNSVAQLYINSQASSDSVINFRADSVQKTKIGWDNSNDSFSIVVGSGSFSTADVVVKTNGDVGIGTTIPSEKLEITGSTPTAGDTTLNLKVPAGNITIGVTEMGNILFSSSDASTGGTGSVAKISTIAGDGAGAWTGNGRPTDLAFFTQPLGASATLVESMRIDQDGNVGIGTDSPENKLHVQQTGLFTGIHNTAGIRIKSDGASASGNYHGTIALSKGTGSVAISAVQEATDSDVMGMAFFTHPSVTGGDASVEQMRIDSTGNVGVGTTSPVYKLSVNGTIQSDLIRGYTYPNNSFLDFDDDQSASSNHTRLASIGRIAYLADTNANEPVANAAHEFFTGTSDIDTATSLMIIETNGNVGIGNTNPSDYSADANNLVVGSLSGNNGITILSTASSGYGSLYFADATTGNKVYSGFIRYQQNQSIMTFGTNEVERMRIDVNGNVGIGTTSPAGNLHVVGASGNSGRIYLSDKDNGGGGADALLLVKTGINSYIYNRDSGDLRLGTNNQFSYVTIKPTGNVGIGTTGPGSLLEVKGPTNSTTSNLLRLVREVDSSQPHKVAAFYSGVNERGSITVNSFVTAYNTSSDYRLKENIKSIDNSVDRLMSLNPCSFNFKSKDKNKLVIDGFIAHEAQEVVPEAVTGLKDAIDKNGDPIYQGIDQSKLIPLLTAALQEAIERIKALENKINK